MEFLLVTTPSCKAQPLAALFFASYCTRHPRCAHLAALLLYPLPGCSCVQEEVVEAGRPAEGVVGGRLVELHEEVNTSILGGIIQVGEVLQEACRQPGTRVQQGR